MDQMVSGEQDLQVDIEAGLSDVTQESTSGIVSGNGVWSGQLNFGVSDYLNPAETSSQSVDHSREKCDNVKFNKSRKATKPPRPPKCSPLSVYDHKVMREMAELAMRKRARIERMKKSLNRIKAAKSSSSSSSSSPWISIFSMIVTVLFFFFLVFQGLFAGNSSLSSDKPLAPTISPNNQLISVQFYNEFAPVEQTDHIPTRYTRKRFSGAVEEESRDVTR